MGHSLVYGPEELASNLKLRLNAKCYELRMHEESGIPDEDFPALDRSRLIKNFNEASSEGMSYLLTLTQFQTYLM